MAKLKLAKLKLARLVNWKQADLLHIQTLEEELLEESGLDLPYFILIISSCAIATFGLLSNSAAVIIGAMVIAPLMLPIRSLALGILMGHPRLVRQGVLAIMVGTGLAVVLSWGLGSITGIVSYGSEILARTQPTLLDLGIAVVAGVIGGYGKIEPKVSTSIAGTAIAVALMPPICVIGLGISQSNWGMSQGAMLLYLTNLLGIALACMLVFLAAGYVPFRQARKPLLGAIALTSLLLIPLGWRFAQLAEQARLESGLRKALVNKTVTFQRLELVDLKGNWLTDPPHIRLVVYAKEAVTPKQVDLIEEFLARELGKKFILVFIVNYVEEIQGDSAATGESKFNQ